MPAVLAYLRDEDGSSAAEYALILAIVGAAVAASMLLLGESVAGATNHAANCIKGGTAATCS